MSNNKRPRNPKVRLDESLVSRGLCESLQLAQSLIMAGKVRVSGERVDKSGFLVHEDKDISIVGIEPFVSRGGLKLLSAIEHFSLNLEDTIAIDLGASTGGFTDCLLQNGASLVYAVDVGDNQLDYKLRTDARVRVYEHTHAKDLSKISFNPQAGFATADLSFISLRQVLPYLVEVLTDKAQLLVLVKPQFELERSLIEPGGVVSNPEHQMLAVELVSQVALTLGLKIEGSFACPVRGSKKKNQEYFLFLQK